MHADDPGLTLAQYSALSITSCHFFHGAHNGHTTARPSGRGMVCLLWVQSLNVFTLLLEHMVMDEMYAISRYIGPPYLGSRLKPDYNVFTALRSLILSSMLSLQSRYHYSKWRTRNCKILRNFGSSNVAYHSSSTSIHYSDVIMGAMASQITSLTSVYSTVYSGVDRRKHQSSASLDLVRGIHQWPVNLPAQMASNAENVSIWWRHHAPSRVPLPFFIR